MRSSSPKGRSVCGHCSWLRATYGLLKTAEMDGETGYGSETSYHLCVGKPLSLGRIPTRANELSRKKAQHYFLFRLFLCLWFGLFWVFF